MRKIIKKIWKIIMYNMSKSYIGHNVNIINTLEKIPKFEETYSQFAQDAYIYNIIFNKINNGVFVDVGANEPIHCNNTYLFEKKGWTGIAIEPQDYLREKWDMERKTKCLDFVIGPDNTDVIFIEGEKDEHGVCGVKDFNKVISKNKRQIVKKQKRLDDILLENNLIDIDYLSIDVEGYELKVLESIDFNRFNIKVIDIENDIGFKYIPLIGKKIAGELGDNKIRSFLKNKGYKQVARIMCDDIFIKIKN